MSIATLSGLRDYLYSTLSPENMLWLAGELKGYAYRQVMPVPSHRYTMQEINAMLDEAEAEITAGGGIPDEEAWDDLEEELVREEESKMPKAV